MGSAIADPISICRPFVVLRLVLPKGVCLDKFVRQIEISAGLYIVADKSEQFGKGYIAAKSGLSRGFTVDLAIVDIGGFDYFGALSQDQFLRRKFAYAGVVRSRKNGRRQCQVPGTGCCRRSRFPGSYPHRPPIKAVTPEESASMSPVN